MELLELIKNIKPDLIFEELEKDIYDRIYKDFKQTTLETNSIKEYLKINNIPHIPVDTFERPKNFHKNIDKMLKRILGKVSKNAFHYRNILDYQNKAKGEYGFKFLNSIDNDNLLEKIDIEKQIVLKEINDNDLFKINSLENEINSKREDEILNNIYDFSSNNPYNQAILFIGSGHRNSILNKIKSRFNNEIIKIDWKLMNG